MNNNSFKVRKIEEPLALLLFKTVDIEIDTTQIHRNLAG